MLGAAGVLRGLPATTHWYSHAELADYGAIPTDARVVAAGKVITAAGVSAGIDMALMLTEKLAGRDYAEALRLLLRAGYWEDAAYVAERVLTVDELKAVVDTTATSLPSPPPRSLPEPDEPQPARDLRHLLVHFHIC